MAQVQAKRKCIGHGWHAGWHQPRQTQPVSVTTATSEEQGWSIGFAQEPDRHASTVVHA